MRGSCLHFRFSRSFVAPIAAAIAVFSASAPASANPLGIWIDHTGRGAVEIITCGSAGALCGKLVWLKDAEHAQACGMDILGDVKPVQDGRWDNGWIFDPDFGQRFDVELTPLANGDLQVVGYAGIKALSQTMIWKRSSSALSRCDTGELVAR